MSEWVSARETLHVADSNLSTDYDETFAFSANLCKRGVWNVNVNCLYRTKNVVESRQLPKRQLASNARFN